jgi:hypothetical protein
MSGGKKFVTTQLEVDAKLIKLMLALIVAKRVRGSGAGYGPSK